MYSDGCKKATISEVDDRKENHEHQEQAEGASLDRILRELPRDDGETHPTASSSNDPRPPCLEPQLGADLGRCRVSGQVMNIVLMIRRCLSWILLLI